MTNQDVAVVLMRIHLRARHLCTRVDLKRSLDCAERLRWRNTVVYEMQALEHAYYALTGRRMYVPMAGTAANQA